MLAIARLIGRNDAERKFTEFSSASDSSQLFDASGDLSEIETNPASKINAKCFVILYQGAETEGKAARRAPIGESSTIPTEPNEPPFSRSVALSIRGPVREPVLLPNQAITQYTTD